VPNFDCATLGGCSPAPSNAFQVIGMGHGKSAGWVNLTSARTSMTLIHEAGLRNQLHGR
jgi:hypothetical protein